MVRFIIKIPKFHRSLCLANDFQFFSPSSPLKLTITLQGHLHLSDGREMICELCTWIAFAFDLDAIKLICMSRHIISLWYVFKEVRMHPTRHWRKQSSTLPIGWKSFVWYGTLWQAAAPRAGCCRTLHTLSQSEIVSFLQHGCVFSWHRWNCMYYRKNVKCSWLVENRTWVFGSNSILYVLKKNIYLLSYWDYNCWSGPRQVCSFIAYREFYLRQQYFRDSSAAFPGLELCR